MMSSARPAVPLILAMYVFVKSKYSLAPDCSRLQFPPNIQSGKYNEMDPILIGTAVSEVSYTDFIALVPSLQTFVGRERAQ